MRKQFPKLARYWIGLVVLVIALFSIPVGYGAAQGTTVTIDPGSSEVAVGAETTVSIKIENIADLYGVEVHLTFDPALLEVVDANSGTDGVQIEAGDLLELDVDIENDVDQSAGQIDFAISQMPPHDPVSGSGVLATITFRGKAAGASAVSFDEALLSDKDGGEITADIQDGTITITGEGDTPTPTSTPENTATSTPTPENTPTPTSTPENTATPTPTPDTTATPTPTPTSTPSPGEIIGHHTVRSTETLFCIGRAYGVDPYAIATQNDILNPSIIHTGNVLAIPYVPRSLPAGRVCQRQFDGDTPSPNCRLYHTVTLGENLYRISLHYNVSMWAIAEANNIVNLNYIRAGQVLCIP